MKVTCKELPSLMGRICNIQSLHMYIDKEYDWEGDFKRLYKASEEELWNEQNELLVKYNNLKNK